MKINIDTACMPWSGLFHVAISFGALCYVIYQNQYTLNSPDTVGLIIALISATIYHGTTTLGSSCTPPATPPAQGQQPA